MSSIIDDVEPLEFDGGSVKLCDNIETQIINKYLSKENLNCSVVVSCFCHDKEKGKQLITDAYKNIRNWNVPEVDQSDVIKAEEHFVVIDTQKVEGADSENPSDEAIAIQELLKREVLIRQVREIDCSKLSTFRYILHADFKAQGKAKEIEGNIVFEDVQDSHSLSAFVIVEDMVSLAEILAAHPSILEDDDTESTKRVLN